MNGHASLNRFYRLVWSCATQGWQVVSEITRGQGKGASARSARRAVATTVASVALASIASLAHAQQAPPATTQLPSGGVVARGAASIGQSGNAMTVNQSSQRAVINWNTFNVGQNASVTFNQPSSQAVTLNRIADQNPSQIYGQINANGQVFLSNPSGIYFSPTAQANVGALTATTHSVGDDAFMAGNMAFSRNGATGSVVNEGRLNAALGGYIALLAPEVRNAGVIVAQAGTVALAAGEVITLNFNGSTGLAGITTTPSAIASLIDNRQAVQAPDGQIILSAVALNKLQAGVIKNSGSLEANSISHKGGVITLEGDDITLTGTSRISATGATGGGTVLVGGDWQGSGNLRQATTVTMAAGASIDASATQQGDGGKVVLWSDVHSADSVTRVAGSIRTMGGAQSGYGGQIETSGHYLQVAPTVAIAAGTGDASGTKGVWLLDPADITIVDSGQGMMATLPSNQWSISPPQYTPLASVNATSIDVGVIANIFNSSSTITISTTNTGSTGTGNITIDTGATLNIPAAKTLNLFADGGLSGSGNITLGGTLSIKQSGNSTYSGAITGAGQVQKQGSGTLTLSSPNSSFTGGLNFVPFNGNPGVIKVGLSLIHI
jgi:filamentous hemagglutinin family protein